ncbi:hypothetical protein PJP07_30355, partial [Mycobacterium kansasii]
YSFLRGLAILPTIIGQQQNKRDQGENNLLSLTHAICKELSCKKKKENENSLVILNLVDLQVQLTMTAVSALLQDHHGLHRT